MGCVFYFLPFNLITRTINFPLLANKCNYHGYHMPEESVAHRAAEPSHWQMLSMD